MDSTPVGVLECIGPQIRCGVPQLTGERSRIGLPDEELRSTGLDVLMPAWTRSISELDDAHLLVDERGELGAVRVTLGRMEVARLTRDGDVVDRMLIASPDERPRAHATLLAVHASVSGPRVVAAEWQTECADSEPQLCTQIHEYLIFDDLVAEPRRLAWPLDPSDEIVADASGLWQIRNGHHPHVDKLDWGGELQWRQTGLLDDSSWWELHAAAAGAGSLAVLVRSGDRTNLIWMLDRRGNVDSSPYSIPFSLEQPRLLADAQGRTVIVGTASSGDLHIARPGEDGRADGTVIRQEEYTRLVVSCAALDPSGDAYVWTTAGGRAASEQREVLCRQSLSHPTRCVELALEAGDNDKDEVRDMVVLEPGVVYVRSGITISRFELSL